MTNLTEKDFHTLTSFWVWEDQPCTFTERNKAIEHFLNVVNRHPDYKIGTIEEIPEANPGIYEVRKFDNRTPFTAEDGMVYLTSGAVGCLLLLHTPREMKILLDWGRNCSSEWFA